jgi:hypothetical protein
MGVLAILNTPELLRETILQLRMPARQFILVTETTAAVKDAGSCQVCSRGYHVNSLPFRRLCFSQSLQMPYDDSGRLNFQTALDDSM